MAQRTHTPLHTGDESPSCGVCSRKARLKLTAPTATLDTPRPISSTESTKRLPMIWLLVHILLGSSFLPAQRRKPIIHFPSSKVPLSPFHPLPQSRSSNFSLFTIKTLSTRSGSPGPEKQTFLRPGQKELLQPQARSHSNRRRWVGVQKPTLGSWALESRHWMWTQAAHKALYRVLLHLVSGLPGAPRHLSGFLLFPSGGSELCFLKIKGLLTIPLRQSSRLLFFVFLAAQSAVNS